MNRFILCGLLGILAGILLTPALRAEDLQPSGPYSIRGALGAAYAVGDSHFNRRSSVDPAIQGAFLYQPLRLLGFFVAYDRPQAGRRLDSEMATGGIRLNLGEYSGWTPFAEAGAGVGRTNTQRDMDRPAAKADIGIEKRLAPQVSLGALLGYDYINTRGHASGLHDIAPMAYAAYHF